MASLTVASWNIEKNGKSSKEIKQINVSGFIDICCTDLKVDVLFLCEVHSAQVENYVNYSNEVYGTTYDVYNFAGGKSNAYVLLTTKKKTFAVNYYKLKGLNRTEVWVSLGKEFTLSLAHFKSGQTKLTKSQIEESADELQKEYKDMWAITGDMNWDIKDVKDLNLQMKTNSCSCWDQTHKKGCVLDWCLAGAKVKVHTTALGFMFKNTPSITSMEGPDHRPVIFDLIWDDK